MKANVLCGVGDLRWMDVPVPELKPGRVLLKMRAAGICGSDNARVFKTGTYHFPTIIGHEFSGEVVSVYNEEDKNLLGLRASVFPLIPCGECESCKQGHYETCSHYDYLGSRSDGGFAEYVSVPKWNLLPIPDCVSFEKAAMMEPTAVAMHALRISGFKIGNSVAVFGPGTIGMLLCRLAMIGGAEKIFLIGRTQAKLDFAVAKGFAHDVCNSTISDIKEWINEKTAGKGVDIAIEGTGAWESLEHCLYITRPMGTVVTMGNPIGDMQLSKDAYWKLLRKQLSMKGTWNSSFGVSPNDWQIVMSLLEKGLLEPDKLITHRFNLKKLQEGLNIMHNGKGYYNKIMIINDGE
jgi:L-iditol 2-dehydrogenase